MPSSSLTVLRTSSASPTLCCYPRVSSKPQEHTVILGMLKALSICRNSCPLGSRPLSTQRTLPPRWNTRSLVSSPHKLAEYGASGFPEAEHYSLYNYTSGRWLYNEEKRLSERRLTFDRKGLCHITAKAVGKLSQDLTSITKIAEGGFYRVFKAAFKDGLEAIIRLPYPCTVPRKYGIASEVATMEFLRLHGVPIPQVFDWSSSAVNEIGSEYMIMEMAAGKELEHTWYTMSVKERMAITEKIVKVEKILFNIKFPACGSIFYQESLEPNLSRITIPPDPSLGESRTFCVGPSTEFLWWYQVREYLDVDRGPWTTSKDVLQAVAKRELAWLHAHGKPRYPLQPLYREFYGRKMVDPQVHVRSLLDYLKITEHIIPEEENFNLPTIRHPDISPNNIFVSDTGDITSIIDWQHCSVLPLFVQAKIPKHFQNYGDDDSENFRPPKLPQEFESLSDQEKQKELELYRRRQLHYFYIGYTTRHNERHFDAMGTYDLIIRNKLYTVAGRPWEGDNTSLKAELIRLAEYWPRIASSSSKHDPYPLQFTDEEMKECLEIDAKQVDADEQMQYLRDFIGVNIDGWVPAESYDRAVAKEREMKVRMLGIAETDEERRDIDENWPFQDHEEID